MDKKNLEEGGLTHHGKGETGRRDRYRELEGEGKLRPGFFSKGIVKDVAGTPLSLKESWTISSGLTATRNNRLLPLRENQPRPPSRSSSLPHAGKESSRRGVTPMTAPCGVPSGPLLRRCGKIGGASLRTDCSGRAGPSMRRLSETTAAFVRRGPCARGLPHRAPSMSASPTVKSPIPHHRLSPAILFPRARAMRARPGLEASAAPASLYPCPSRSM